MKFTKENTQVEIKTFNRTDKETGEIKRVELILLCVDDYMQPLPLSYGKQTRDEVIQYMYDNPEWRDLVEIAPSKYQEGTYYAYINTYVSDVEIERLNV